MLNTQDKIEMNIILNRAGYVLTVCSLLAVIVVMVLIYKSK